MRLADFRGRVVLLNFWATWCAPCQIEMPRFSAWQARYGPEGLQVVGVSMDDEEAPVRSLVKKRKVDYPIVMGDEKLGLLYGGILGLPVTLSDRQRGHASAPVSRAGPTWSRREARDLAPAEEALIPPIPQLIVMKLIP